MGQAVFVMFFSVAGFALAAVIYQHRKLRDGTDTGATALLASLCCWTIVEAASFLTPDGAAGGFYAGLSFACAMLLPAAWLHYLLGRRHKHGFGSIISAKAVYVVVVILALAAFFNPGGIFHSGTRELSLLGVSFRRVEYSAAGAALLCALSALPAMLAPELYRESRAERYGYARSLLCALCAFVPVCAGAASALGMAQWDIFPLLYMASLFALNTIWGGKLLAGWNLSRGEVFGAVNDGIVLLDGKNRVIDINRLGLEMLDLSGSAQPLAHAGETLARWCEQSRQSIGSARFVQKVEHSAKGTRYYRVSGSTFSTGRGANKKIMMLLQDDTQLYKPDDRAEDRDGLSSRSDFTKTLEQEVARCTSYVQSNAVICASIANFVSFCNLYGNDFGEALQREVRLRVQGMLRAHDAISRFFDDEFYMSFRFSDDSADGWQNSLRVIRRMNSLFDLPVMVGGTAVMVRFRCGVALCPHHSSAAEKLTAMAKVARMNAEKLSQLCVCYDESMGSEISRYMQIEQGLRTALENGEMFVVYQPQVNMATGRVSGVEALLRWNSRTLGSVSPGEFIPIAEQTGYIHSIGLWVLRKSAAQAYEWRRQGIKNIKIAVNISLYQLTAANFSDEVIALTHEFGLEHGMLELEITESVALSPETMAHGHLPRLRRHGLRVALDDFGMGHSSLNYIKEFEVDTIKIDRALSQDILANPTSVAMIRSLCTLCESIGADTVVEYVEFREQLDMLARIGCNVIQGYIFSPPLPADKCTAFVLTSPFKTMLRRMEGAGNALKSHN